MIIEGDAQAVNSWLGSNFDNLWCLAKWVGKIRKVFLFFLVSLVRILNEDLSQVVPVVSLGHFFVVVSYRILLFFSFNKFHHPNKKNMH